MSALTFSLKQTPLCRVDLAALTPDKLSDLSIDQIRKIKLQYGRQQLDVADLFDINGSATEQLVFSGDLSKCDFIGRAMSQGEIRVEGNVGAYFGMQMKAGTLFVEGNTDLMTACEMKGGILEINGNAGDLLGSAQAGSRTGMAGGTVLVRGNSGNRTGDLMRRGTILVEGNTGDYCASRMIAGTIGVLGSVGSYLGYSMNRGTILLWQQPDLAPTFADSGVQNFNFLPMLFGSYKDLGSKFTATDVPFRRARRMMGDTAAMGLGEVLIAS